MIAIMYGLRVVRWHQFLKPVADVPYRPLASATLIGFMSSCILPLRAGEVIRPYVAHKRGGISFGHAAGTAMGLERVFDLVGVCFLVLLMWFFLQGYTPPETATEGASSLRLEEIWRYGRHFALVGGVGLVGMALLAFVPGPIVRLAGFFLRILPDALEGKLMGFLHSIVQSMTFLHSPVRAAVGLVLSCVIWGCFPVSTWCMARAFGLGLPFAGALVVQVIVTVAVAAPQAPAFIGVFHTAAITGAELFQVARGPAAAFAILLWAINVLPVTAAGLAVLWYEGLSLRGLAREAAASQEAEEQAHAEPGEQAGGD